MDIPTEQRLCGVNGTCTRPSGHTGRHIGVPYRESRTNDEAQPADVVHIAGEVSDQGFTAEVQFTAAEAEVLIAAAFVRGLSWAEYLTELHANDLLLQGERPIVQQAIRVRRAAAKESK